MRRLASDYPIPDFLTMASIREVRKRDGSVVPFDRTRIADAIRGAYASALPGHDPTLPEELAEAVEYFLDVQFGDGSAASPPEGGLLESRDTALLVERIGSQRTAPGEVVPSAGDCPSSDALATPGIEAIQDVVETVLLEMGDRAAAMAYIRYRQQRALVREASVHSEATRPVYGWSREDLERLLFEEPAVERDPDASGTAQRPERSGAQAVREFIADDILTRFSLDALHSPEVAAAHREGRLWIHRLTQPLRLPRLSWRIPAARAGRRVRGASPRLLSPSFSFIEGGEPPRSASGADRSAEVQSADPGSFRDFDEFCIRVEQYSLFVCEEIRLTGLPNVLRDRPPADRSESDLVDEALQRFLDISSRSDGAPRIDWVIELDLDHSALPWLEGLLRIPSTERRRLRLRLRPSPTWTKEPLRLQAQVRSFVDSRTAYCVAALYAAGDRVEFLPAETGSRSGGAEAFQETRAALDTQWTGGLSSRRLAPGADAEPSTGDRGGLEVSLGKVTLNLARAVERAQVGGGDLESELDELLDLASVALLERRALFERGAARPDSLLGQLFSVGAHRSPRGDLGGELIVGVCGLEECVRRLTGASLHESERAQLRARQLLQRLADGVRRTGQRVGASLRLEETEYRGPLAAAWNVCTQPEGGDRDERRRVMFGAASVADPGAGEGGIRAQRRYTDGVRWHVDAPVDPLERARELLHFLPWVRPMGSVLEDSVELRDANGDLLLSLLEECLPMLATAATGRQTGEGQEAAGAG